MTRRPIPPVALALIAAAAVTRFVGLGSRFPHHDETIHAWMAHEIVRGAGYHYDPVYHGPLLYHLEAFVFDLAGAGDAQSRLVPAAFGVALIALLYFALRPHLGERAALLAATFGLLSPSLTYYTRFNSHDALIAVFTVVMVAAPFDYRRAGLMWFGAALGLAIATKLNAYFVLGTLALYLAGRAAYGQMVGHPLGVGEFCRHRKGYLALAAALAALLMALLSISTAIFHVRATHSLSAALVTTVNSMLFGGFRHWWAMHQTPRLGGPFHFYLPILFIYEPLLFLGAPAALLFYMRRRVLFLAVLAATLTVVWFVVFHSPFEVLFNATTPIQGWHTLLAAGWLLAGLWCVVSLWSADREFLACWTFVAVLQFLLYSYANEKVPWLVVHIMLPWLVVVSALVVDLWETSRSRHVRLAVIAFVVVVEVFTARTTSIVNTRNRNNVAEPLLQLHYADVVADVTSEVGRFVRSSGGRATVAIEPAVQWPFGWYFRDLRVDYLPQAAGERLTADVLIADDHDLPPSVSGQYERSRLDYSRWSWWIRQVNSGDIAGMLRFMLRHDHWGEEDRAGFSVWRRNDPALRKD